MNIGTIEIEGTGLTNGHPAVIVSGRIKTGTICAVNGLLSLNTTTGKFEAFDTVEESGAACIALEPVTIKSTVAKVLLHGTFDGSVVVKADGNALSSVELAEIQKNSQIYFV